MSLKSFTEKWAVTTHSLCPLKPFVLWLRPFILLWCWGLSYYSGLEAFCTTLVLRPFVPYYFGVEAFHTTLVLRPFILLRCWGLLHWLQLRKVHLQGFMWGLTLTVVYLPGFMWGLISQTSSPVCLSFIYSLCLRHLGSIHCQNKHWKTIDHCSFLIRPLIS